MAQDWRRAVLRAVRSRPNPKPEGRRPKETRRPKSEWGEERHVSSLTHGQEGVCGAHLHAAPDGAWMAFRGSSSINVALLAELSRSPNTLETAKNRLEDAMTTAG